MTKLFWFFFPCFLTTAQATAQQLEVVVNYIKADQTDENKIFYTPGVALTWTDFKGKPSTASYAAALTNAGFGLQLKFRRLGNNSQLQVDVNCTFSKKDSWVKPGHKTPYILNHEQKHFDLSYLHTVLFMKKIREATFTNDNYAAVIERIYNETARLMTKAQQQYDAETNHSRIKEKQAAWDLAIQQQLNAALQSP